MSTSFSEQIFDELAIPWGIQGGSQFSTTVVATNSGFEQRQKNWIQPLGKWTIGGDRTLLPSELEDFKNFFNARAGKFQAFRYRNIMDFSDSGFGRATGIDASGVSTGTPDGTNTSRMFKLYNSGDETLSKRIFKPRSATISVFVDALKKTEGTDYTLDYTTGVVTWLGLSSTWPTAADVVSWTGYYDTPVRFDNDTLTMTVQATYTQVDATGTAIPTEVYVQLNSIDIVEVRLTES